MLMFKLDALERQLSLDPLDPTNDVAECCRESLELSRGETRSTLL